MSIDRNSPKFKQLATNIVAVGLGLTEYQFRVIAYLAGHDDYTSFKEGPGVLSHIYRDGFFSSENFVALKEVMCDEVVGAAELYDHFLGEYPVLPPTETYSKPQRPLDQERRFSIVRLSQKLTHYEVLALAAKNPPATVVPFYIISSFTNLVHLKNALQQAIRSEERYTQLVKEYLNPFLPPSERIVEVQKDPLVEFLKELEELKKERKEVKIRRAEIKKRMKELERKICEY
jgi:hypothetical protein